MKVGLRCVDRALLGYNGKKLWLETNLANTAHITIDVRTEASYVLKLMCTCHLTLI